VPKTATDLRSPNMSSFWDLPLICYFCTILQQIELINISYTFFFFICTTTCMILVICLSWYWCCCRPLSRVRTALPEFHSA